MPLSLCKIGENLKISKISGTSEVKNHLYDLGFVEGSNVSIVNTLAGNLIVNVKDSRVALDKKLASKIWVE
jgi:ferrous iron transport protein A